MKRINGNIRIILAGITAFSLFVCLLSSALIPLNNMTLEFDFINHLQSFSFFTFLTFFMVGKVFFKKGREKTINFFKNFLKKQSNTVLEKKLPDADCGCKKK